MRNNLLNVEKNLRSIAKRYKSVKYSIGLAILFLMMGVNAFSEEITTADNAAANQTVMTRAEIKSTAAKLQEQLNELKKQNQDVTKGAKLELIQLMEQGNQVVKSPWASWQFGVNFFYDHWGSTYKGRGDKAEKYPYEGVFTRDGSSTTTSKANFDRYVSPQSSKYSKVIENSSSNNDEDSKNASNHKRPKGSNSYGLGSVKIPQEPITSVKIAVSITPKSIEKDPIDVPPITIEPPHTPKIDVDITKTDEVIVNPPDRVEMKVNTPEPNAAPFVSYYFDDRQGSPGITDNIDKGVKYSISTGYTAVKKSDRSGQEISYTFWRGYNPETKITDYKKSGSYENVTASPHDGKPSNATSNTNLVYIKNFSLDRDDKDPGDGKNPNGGFILRGAENSPLTLYLKGITLDEKEKKRLPYAGASGIHSVWNAKFENIEGYLKGNAAFFSFENWHVGKITLEKVKADIEGEDNTLFFFMPGEFNRVLSNNDFTHSYRQRGEINGQVEADFSSNRNIVYSVYGVTGSLNLRSKGAFNFEGSNNIIYSGIGYAPNFQKLVGNKVKRMFTHLGIKPGETELAIGGLTDQDKNLENTTTGALDTDPKADHSKDFADGYKGMTPLINIETHSEVYGDENIGLFFSDRTKVDSKEKPFNSDSQRYEWGKTKIGIFQGDTRLRLKIGDRLAKKDGAEEQTENGNTQNAADSKKWAEKNVGILAQSGQREGINIEKNLVNDVNRLLIKDTNTTTNPKDLSALDQKDPIHSLHVHDIDVTFGVNAKSNMAIVADRGTVIDVATPNLKKAAAGPEDVLPDGDKEAIENRLNTKAKDGVTENKLKDYYTNSEGQYDPNKEVKSSTDNTNQAATATIYAVAKGIWGDSERRTKDDGVNSKKMEDGTVESLRDLPSEINFGVGLDMASKAGVKADNTIDDNLRSVAYLADGGKITAKDTSMNGFGSVVANAINGGNIQIDGTIKAVDKWVVTTNNELLRKNMGAYASGEAVVIEGKSYDVFGKEVGENLLVTDPTTSMSATPGTTSFEIKERNKNPQPQYTPGDISTAYNIKEKYVDVRGKEYVFKNSTVTINGKSEIKGILAFAVDNGFVKMNANNNVGIIGGKQPSIVAQTGGKVDFGGGTIVIDDSADIKALPFYADEKSKISFKHTTRLQMNKGLFLTGQKSMYSIDYKDPFDTNALRYNGIKNLELQLTGNDVNVGTIDGYRGSSKLTWGTTGILQSLKDTIGLKGIINEKATKGVDGIYTSSGDTGNSYYSYQGNILNSDLEITTGNINLNKDYEADLKANYDNASKEDRLNATFNRIKMANTMVDIASSVTITGDAKEIKAKGHQGLSMGAGDGTNNLVTGYRNAGTIVIDNTGTAKAAAVNVDLGTIENSGTIKLNGAGSAIYGENNSILKNTGTVEITGADSAAIYGKTPTKVTIENSGEIKATGNASTAIYAHNEAGVAMNDVNVTINNGSKITVKEQGTGIFVNSKDDIHAGGTVTLKGTSDITTGAKGIGIYAKNSALKLDKLNVTTSDEGTGIYLTGDQSSLIKTTPSGEGKLNVKYTGSATAKVKGIVYNYENAENEIEVVMDNQGNTESGIVNIYANGSGTFINNAKLKTANAAKNSFAIYGQGLTKIINNAGADIEVAETTTTGKDKNIGIYVSDTTPVENFAKILVNKKSVGINGNSVETKNGSVLDIKDEATGIYSAGGNVTVAGDISIANKGAVGIYAEGAGQVIKNNATNFKIGESSYGIINSPKDLTVMPGNNVESTTGSVILPVDSVFIYSKDSRSGAKVINRTNLTTNGDGNYGIYSAGNVDNYGNIDMTKGIGNVGIYSTLGGTATNKSGAIITVGASNIKAKPNAIYSIGMAAGYTKTENEEIKTYYTGNIVNESGAKIKVVGKDGIAMFAAGEKDGKKSSAKNYGDIELSADGAIGIYAENGAEVLNAGNITTTKYLKGVRAVILGEGSTLNNTGNIKVEGDSKSSALLLKGGTVKNYGNIVVSGDAQKEESAGLVDSNKGMAGVKIDIKDPNGKFFINGKVVGNKAIADLYKRYYKDGIPAISDDEVEKNLGNIYQSVGKAPKYVSANSIGMYVDTSGVFQTKPIENVGYLTEEADLIIGAEAANRTLKKFIVINDNDIPEKDRRIVEPYAQSILNNNQVKKWNIYSGSLTWMGFADISPSGRLTDLYLAKVPYTAFASNEPTPVEVTDTYNFLDGLEQRYGVDGLGTRERRLFEKLNMIGNNESVLFHQAVDEMMGHQYANTQQRVYQTGSILDKEFSYLKKEWQTFSKDSNKVKVFGAKGQYKTDTAGVIDTTNHGYGVAYLHEDETVRLGKTLGWYAGIVENDYRFKDIGNSKEKMLQGKVGVFKSYPFDYDNSLNATVYGELLAGYNRMHRKFLVVDEIFNAKSRYKTYGAAIKGEVSKEFRLSEDFRLKPYASLKYEYGRIGKIRERSGEIKLEVKSNTYHSLKPEIGGELEYKHDFGSYRTFRTILGIAYENELGRVADGRNKARVADTQADWFNIRGEKEDRRGNVKSDLKIGIDNSRVGATLDFGYDTKGNNVRGGLGLRIIY